MNGTFVFVFVQWRSNNNNIVQVARGQTIIIKSIWSSCCGPTIKKMYFILILVQDSTTLYIIFWQKGYHFPIWIKMFKMPEIEKRWYGNFKITFIHTKGVLPKSTKQVMMFNNLWLTFRFIHPDCWVFARHIQDKIFS